jgi:hypothetical protein
MQNSFDSYVAKVVGNLYAKANKLDPIIIDLKQGKHKHQIFVVVLKF